jgi:hypothetical protein
MTSPIATPYAVHCKGDEHPLKERCGFVYLTYAEYVRQLGKPDSLWQCPNCGSTAHWDDDNYEEERNRDGE